MLAIAGGKGGCGKTTTTVCLARGLARRGDAPLAVDTDTTMPDLHVAAGVPASPGLDAVDDGRDPTSITHTDQRTPHLRVLPAGGIDADALGPALRRLCDVDGPVLLDCPAGAGCDAARPLEAATATLLVTTPTVAAVEDTVKTAAMARELGADPLGVVSVSRRPESQPHVERLTDGRARQLFDTPLLARIPAVSGHPAADEAVRSRYESVVQKVRERNI